MHRDLRGARVVLSLCGWAACQPSAPGPSAPPPAAPAEPAPSEPEATPVETPTPPPETPPAAPPTEAPATTPVAYPTVYCAFGDTLTDRWIIEIDPTEKADLKRVERLVDRYPDADGHTGALSRSNVPEQWREIRDVTLVSLDGAATTQVKKVGVRPSPSGGSFVFVLDAKTTHPDGTLAVALDGHAPTAGLAWNALEKLPSVDPERWTALQAPLEDYVAARRPRAARPSLRPESVQWLEADFGGGVAAIVVTTAKRRGRFPSWSAIAAVDDKGGVLEVPIVQSDEPAPPAGVLEHAFFRPLALVDLDRDGHVELVVREDWPEGAFTWIVRYDGASGGLAAQRICGDAS